MTLIVEIGLSAAIGPSALWDNSVWDSAVWGTGDDWQDVTERVRQIDTDGAFSRDVRAWEASTALVVLDNRDGALNPSNPHSPYRVNGVPSIRPWRPIRVRAERGGVMYDVWYGYIKPWKERYLGVAGPGTGDVELTLSCVDEFGSLARFNPPEQAAIGGGEISGRRIHRILDNAGHTGLRDIAVGNVTMQATTLSQNVVTELKVTADSEGGSIFVDQSQSGAVTFEHQYALIENARSNSVQATWGDDVSQGELPYTDAEVEYDADLIANDVSMSRAGGTAQRFTDEASRALYGPSGQPRMDLMCETDAQAANLAQFEVLQYAQPQQRISRIDVNPINADPAMSARLWPVVLRTRVRDLHRVFRRPPGNYTIVRDCHVAGIHHRIRLDEWTTSLDLFSADMYQTVGRWDYAKWDSSTWFI